MKTANDIPLGPQNMNVIHLMDDHLYHVIKRTPRYLYADMVWVPSSRQWRPLNRFSEKLSVDWIRAINVSMEDYAAYQEVKKQMDEALTAMHVRHQKEIDPIYKRHNAERNEFNEQWRKVMADVLGERMLNEVRR